MSNSTTADKTDIHAQRRQRRVARDLRVANNLATAGDAEIEVEASAASDEGKRGRKLKAEELGLSENRNKIRIGMTSQARRIIDWEIGPAGSLLVAGYGVAHVSYLLQSITAHYREHKVPIFGLDFLDMINNYPKGTFTKLLSYRRDEAVELLEQLTQQPGEQVLILTQLGNLLNPVNSTMSTEAQAATREEIVDLLIRLINDDHTHVIITSSKLKAEADLPQRLIDALPTRVIAGKIFANEGTRLLTEADKKRSDNASIWHNLLVHDGTSQVFQNARVNLIRNY